MSRHVIIIYGEARKHMEQRTLEEKKSMRFGFFVIVEFERKPHESYFTRAFRVIGKPFF